MHILFKIFLALGALAIAIFVNGVVTMTLWKWLIVPTFDLPELNFSAALGVALIITWFTDKSFIKGKEGFELTAVVAIWTLFVLSYGFILSFYI